jgi:hypothetical protein
VARDREPLARVEREDPTMVIRTMAVVRATMSAAPAPVPAVRKSRGMRCLASTLVAARTTQDCARVLLRRASIRASSSDL